VGKIVSQGTTNGMSSRVPILSVPPCEDPDRIGTAPMKNGAVPPMKSGAGRRSRPRGSAFRKIFNKSIPIVDTELKQLRIKGAAHDPNGNDTNAGGTE